MVLAIPALIFAAGFFGVLFGILEPPGQAEPSAETDAGSVPYRKPIDPSELAPAAPDASLAARADAAGQDIQLDPLPADLDEVLALGWLSANRLLTASDGGVVLDRARFSILKAREALALLWAFKDAQDAATGPRRDQMQLLAGYVFMGAAYMPEAERLAFAQDAQAVAWPGPGGDATRSGEFVLMFYLKDGPDRALADVAIRQFAPMLPGSDVMESLERVRAIRPRRNDGEIWRYDLDRIAHLSPATLQSMLDVMAPYDWFDAEDLVDFSYSQDRLRNLIEMRASE